MREERTKERPLASPGNERRAVVELAGITKRFGDFTAVEDLNLNIYEGEFFSLLGPSGCGKTTTLRMIAGFEEPTEGTITIAGQTVQGMPPYHRPVNTVFQSYAVFPHLNVFDNVAFGLRRAGVKGEELRRRVTEACDMVQLSGLEKRKPAKLSGGQQQRVALARALVNRPKVLLLDEPLGALDRKLREGMQIELKNLQETVGITFIYVTHDQEEALTMSDRIAVMNEGRVQQVADPATLYELPRSRFVADFIGLMNMLSGTVESVSGRQVTLRAAGGKRVEAIIHEDAGMRPGAEVHVAVRPEKMRFGDEGDNVYAARVRQVIYMGVSTQYMVELEGGEKMMLYQQNASGVAGYRAGDRISVAWDAANSLVLES